MNTPSRSRILCLSNGHGEDQVAVRIVQKLIEQGVEVVALPIVGEGNAYRRLGIPLLDAVQTMPSGGFIYEDFRQFWRDLRGGLIGLTGRQLRQIQDQRSQVDLVLAVGDIVVLIMAWLSQVPFAFVGTAKSDYYWRDEQGPYHPHGIPWLPWIAWTHYRSDYLPWERWLMRRSTCQGVFPRDTLTAKNLQRFRIPVFDLGNPMMDDLTIPPDPIPLHNQIAPDRPAVLLLPGSRPPEAYRNWHKLVTVVQHLPPDVIAYAAIAPSLSEAILTQLLPSSSRRIPLITNQFGACAHRADVVLAMAGTATEQCVGLGKPVVTLAGEGPQFTYRFAEAQTRLLGSSIYLTPPTSAATVIQHLLKRLQEDPCFQAELQAHGQTRMGSPGASERIAQQICTWLPTYRSNDLKGERAEGWDGSAR